MEHRFTVQAGVEEVWEAVSEAETVVRCLPGAQLLHRLSDDACQVALSVDLGAGDVDYRGQLEVLERDATARRTVLRGKARETRGQGTAEVTVELRLDADDGATSATVHADASMTGRAASLDRATADDVAERWRSGFAENLRRLADGELEAAGTVPSDTPAVDDRSAGGVEDAVEVASAATAHQGVERPAAAATPGGSPVEQTGGDDAMTGGQVVSGPGSRSDAVAAPQSPPPEAASSGGAQSLPGARAGDRRAGASERVGVEELSNDAPTGRGSDEPARRGRAFALTALVAVMAYLVGRRAR